MCIRDRLKDGFSDVENRRGAPTREAGPKSGDHSAADVRAIVEAVLQHTGGGKSEDNKGGHGGKGNGKGAGKGPRVDGAPRAGDWNCSGWGCKFRGNFAFRTHCLKCGNPKPPDAAAVDPPCPTARTGGAAHGKGDGKQGGGGKGKNQSAGKGGGQKGGKGGGEPSYAELQAKIAQLEAEKLRPSQDAQPGGIPPEVPVVFIGGAEDTKGDEGMGAEAEEKAAGEGCPLRKARLVKQRDQLRDRLDNALRTLKTEAGWLEVDTEDLHAVAQHELLQKMAQDVETARTLWEEARGELQADKPARRRLAEAESEKARLTGLLEKAKKRRQEQEEIAATAHAKIETEDGIIAGHAYSLEKCIGRLEVVQAEVDELEPEPPAPPEHEGRGFQEDVETWQTYLASPEGWECCEKLPPAIQQVVQRIKVAAAPAPAPPPAAPEPLSEAEASVLRATTGLMVAAPPGGVPKAGGAPPEVAAAGGVAMASADGKSTAGAGEADGAPDSKKCKVKTDKA